MIADSLQLFRRTPMTTFYEGLSASELSQYEASMGFRFPEAHRELLQMSNGVEAYQGFFRLFSLGNERTIDALVWNDPDYWKFAWEDRATGYWCFGETPAGDQYAYSLESLHRGSNVEVFLLDAFCMVPEVLASSFEKFFEDDFLRNAQKPYDDRIIFAQQKWTRLDAENHLNYMPPIALVGADDAENLLIMPARAAMICNGDIAIQLDNGPEDQSVCGIEPYEDARQLQRLRLRWC